MKSYLRTFVELIFREITGNTEGLANVWKTIGITRLGFLFFKCKL